MPIGTWMPSVRLRRPEYTGENRCYPCTILNVILASVVGILGWMLSPLLGVAVIVVSFVAIYFRGYLVPGTPTITKRYFPDRVLAWFDKDDASPQFEAEDFDPETTLLEWGIVEVCEGGDDLCFDDEVRARIEETVERYRDDPVDLTRLARMFDTDVESINRRNRANPTMVIHDRLQKWPSDVAILSDTAINDTLAKMVDDWEERPLAHRLQLIEGLRPFHETCPACHGSLSIDESVVESCCRSRSVVQVQCTDCESVLFEIDAKAIEMAE